ncbi:hypothetical protein [Gibbsiella quercinecans]|uniref:hypothetical protein n=1 Tax=Gibbsiella quercinecans TaxID=929813 RepID=UPI0011C42D51|nr:hypothetical protein [Gibbsiella quercinecans]
MKKQNVNQCAFIINKITHRGTLPASAFLVQPIPPDGATKVRRVKMAVKLAGTPVACGGDNLL